MKLDFDFSRNRSQQISTLKIWGAGPSLSKPFLLIIAAIIVGVVVGGYFLSWWTRQIVRALDKAQLTEEADSASPCIKAKFAASANLELYRQQMSKIWKICLPALLKRLPASHETPGLLDDITYVGTTSGLTFVSINWQPESDQRVLYRIAHHHRSGGEIPRVRRVRLESRGIAADCHPA